MKNDFQKGLDEMLKKAELPTPKQKFIIDIEETLVKPFEIEAETMGEAMQIAEAKYWNNEFNMECGADIVMTRMRAFTEDFSEETEWTEF